MEEARPPIAELLERAGNLRKHCRSLDSESKTLRGFFDIVDDYEIDDKATAIDAYAGWMQREGKSEGVILSRISFITKWVDEELYREVSEGRLRISQLLRGLRWCQGLRGIRNVKPLFALGTLADVLTKEPPIRDREPNNLIRFRVLWYLAIVTGNRMCHIRGAKKVELRDDGIVMHWGPRKVAVIPPTAGVLYKFAWTMPPPDEIRGYISVIGIPQFGRPETMACAVNAWIHRLETGLSSAELGCSGLTSATPRVHLANVLAELAVKKEMTEDIYRLLMDHEIKQSLQTYRRTDEFPRELLRPGDDLLQEA